MRLNNVTPPTKEPTYHSPHTFNMISFNLR